MRVRDWQDIVEDVTDSGADPGGWRAVGGDRGGGIGEDMYIGHPAAGVYQLKTYAKNPMSVEGVGTQVARRIDEDIDPLFPEEGTGVWGVQQGPDGEDEARETAQNLETVLETHADAPTSPQALIEDMLDAMDSPAYGPMEYDQYGRPDRLDELSDTFDEAQQLLETEFEDVVHEDVERGFY